MTAFVPPSSTGTTGTGVACRSAGPTDPYLVLVSETILQQTQVARGGPAWAAFVGRFPTVEALAAATPADVLRAWRGLGYNRRAINLQRAARIVVDELGGAFPTDVAGLERLPGVGPYTARAVAAIAYGLPVGAVDTNVRRVLGRVVGGSAAGVPPRDLQALADALARTDRAADWTHALMDLGSTVCRPRRPRCDGLPGSRRDAAGRPGARRTPRTSEAVRASRAPRGRPAFAATNRWLRGRIVDRLRAPTGPPGSPFDAPIGDHDAGRSRRRSRRWHGDGLVELDAAARRRARCRSADQGRPRRVGYAERRERDRGAIRRRARCPPTTPASSRRPARARPALGGDEDRAPMTAEAMTGADRRAQALGVPGGRLMEHAGTAVAAAVRAVAEDQGRLGQRTDPRPVRPGQQRRRRSGRRTPARPARAARRGRPVSAANRPGTPDAARNWDRLAGEPTVTASTPRSPATWPSSPRGSRRPRRGRRAARHRRPRRAARTDPDGGRAGPEARARRGSRSSPSTPRRRST